MWWSKKRQQERRRRIIWKYKYLCCSALDLGKTRVDYSSLLDGFVPTCWSTSESLTDNDWGLSAVTAESLRANNSVFRQVIQISTIMKKKLYHLSLNFSDRSNRHKHTTREAASEVFYIFLLAEWVTRKVEMKISFHLHNKLTFLTKKKQASWGLLDLFSSPSLDSWKWPEQLVRISFLLDRARSP